MIEMFRQTKIDDPDSDKASEVAAVIAEEGLRYVNDTSPGYRRKRVGKSFSYFDKDNKQITNADVLRRIKSIGIPPHTKLCGYALPPMDMFKRLVSMRAVANSTDIIQSGGRSRSR